MKVVCIKKSLDDWWTLKHYCPTPIAYLWKIFYKIRFYEVDIRDV